MGLKIITDDRPVTVRRFEKTSKAGNPYVDYALLVASKDKDGNWVNGLVNCNFKFGTEINDKSKITISNAFYTVSEYNGKTYPKLFILDYEVIEDGIPANKNVDDEGFMQIPDDGEELPFS